MKKVFLLFFATVTLSFSAQTPIHHFTFDETLVNTNKTATFNGTAKYTKDRAGLDKKAVSLNQEALTANIGNLPQFNTPRTVSIWIKFNDISNSNYIWGYGAASNNQYCGLIHQGTSTDESPLNIAAWGYKNDYVTTLPLSPNVWYNYVYVYDGAIANLFRNGVLIESFNAPDRNTLGSIFKLGNINSLISINATIDDLKIYNTALSINQVLDLYSSESALVVVESKKSNKGKSLSTSRSTPSKHTKAIALFQ
jgi:hypothetical protein